MADSEKVSLDDKNLDKVNGGVKVTYIDPNVKDNSKPNTVCKDPNGPGAPAGNDVQARR